ncbi:MAG: GH3 [uncultured Solirubrobacteraceae bacterium]|uniref:GH3 n=1 Tax=uncultured Solirubrobacteraceae bacterium TaxID=1162706 RepID=A0A6J4TNL1_9ACTN|nr:MAG: GH3 [uncultured Solirubrobacteraceae bacterium]
MPRSGSHPGAPVWVALGVVGLLLLVIAVASGGSGGGADEKRAAKPEATRGTGTTPVRAKAGAAVAAQVRSVADRMSLPAQVSQLFLVDAVGRMPRSVEWGLLRTGSAGPPLALRRAIRRVRGVRPMVAAQGLPDQPRAARRGARRTETEYRRVAASLRGNGVRLGLELSLDLSSGAGPEAGTAFSDDPGEVSELGVAALEGARAARLPLAVGHFPGQGAASQDPIDGPASVGVSRDRLRERDLAPFRSVASTVPVMVVSSALYNAYDPTTPAALAPEIVGGELRRGLGFRGVAMTDRLAGLAVVGGSSSGGAAVQALRAGIDLVWAGDEREARAGRDAVLQALRERRLKPARVREALERVLELKRGAGLL